MKALRLLPFFLIGCGDSGGLDVGAIRSTSGTPTTGNGDGEGGPCEVDLSECSFTTYNLDVQVGDRFVITNFLERCEGQVGADFIFVYEDDETWNLDAFNSDRVVEI